MTIRHLVIAALMVGAGAAQADTISSSTSAPPTFLSGWNAGNGVDVLNSGILESGTKFIGGVAHSVGSSASATLADILEGKASASIAQENGQTTMRFVRGIEADYMVGKNMAIMAAAMGTNVSLVNSGDGAVVQDGLISNGGTAGGGAAGDAIGSGTPSGSAGGSAGGSVGVTVPGIGLGAGNGVGNGIGNGVGNGIGNGVGNGNGVGSDAVDVPEPASLALMLAGMLGVGAARRRSR